MQTHKDWIEHNGTKEDREEDKQFLNVANDFKVTKAAEGIKSTPTILLDRAG